MLQKKVENITKSGGGAGAGLGAGEELFGPGLRDRRRGWVVCLR